MRLEPLLHELEHTLGSLRKDHAKLGVVLKKWNKAVEAGEVSALDRIVEEAEKVATELSVSVCEAKASWQYDPAYLAEGHWLDEVEELAQGITDLRVLRDGSSIVAPPSLVRVATGRPALILNGKIRTALRPSLLIKDLRGIAASKPAGGAEFLESLYGAWRQRKDQANPLGRLRDIYELFALAPGWKKENPESSFAQRLYALHTSGIYTAKDGAPFNIQEPASKVSARDLFEIRARDGRLIRYYGISFSPENRT